MKKTLVSYLGQQALKDRKIAEMEHHRKLDNLVQGTYFSNGKGCAVTCTMYHPDEFKGHVDTALIHKRYETELGIPRIIARLEDRIFEGLPVEEAREFPLKFLKAVPVGKDLEPVWRKFLVWLLVDEQTGVVRHAKTDQVREAITNVAKLIERSLTEEISAKEFWAVRDAALSARRAAAAAYAAAADAADAAAYAAYAAAAYAAYAAYAAAAYAADAADAAADAADAAARRNARFARYSTMAAKLIELLEAA